MLSAKRILLWGVLLAITIAVGAWAIAHYSGGYQRFLHFTQRITPAQWSALIVATACFYLLDYVRLYALFALLGVRVALGTGIRLTCVSYFVSSLTPTAELNIPAMMLLLHQRGIPMSQTAAVAVVKTLYVTVWVCLFGFVAVLTRQVELPAAIAHHVVLLTAPALSLIGAFFWIVFHPAPVLRWTSSAAASRVRWQRTALRGLHDCASALSRVGKSTHPMHLAAHLACIAFIVVYALIGMILCRSTGIDVSAGKALAVFSASLLVSYLAPVPGSIGVSEVLTSYFLDPEMTERGMVVSTLLRFLCAYVLVIPGIVILANAIRAVGWKYARRFAEPERS